MLKPGATFADLALPAGEQRWDRVFNTGIFETSAAVQPTMNVRYYATRFANARVDSYKLLDLMLSKKIAVTERVQVDLCAEMYNALNTANMRGVNTTPTSPAFGQYSVVNGYARQYQFSVKMRF